MPLFEVAVLQHEKDKEERLILPPTPMIARNADSAKLAAVRMIDNNVDLNNCQVLVRLFPVG
jgi:hypothetical protein